MIAIDLDAASMIDFFIAHVILLMSIFVGCMPHIDYIMFNIR